MKQDQASVVARRLVCLYALFIRAWAEAKHRRAPDSRNLWNLSARELSELSSNALEDPGLRASFTAREKQSISKPLGRLAIWQIAEGRYRAEGIETLAWALGGTKLARRWYRGTRLTYEVLKPAEMLTGHLPDFLATPVLRKRTELVDQREYEELWAWRFRMSDVRLTIGLASSPNGLDEAPGIEELFSRQIARRAAEARDKGWLKPIRNDFPVGRRTFAAAFQESIIPRRDFAPYANERLRAMNWVLNPAQPWHRTSTATPLGFVLPRRMVGARWFLVKYLSPADDRFWYR